MGSQHRSSAGTDEISAGHTTPENARARGPGIPTAAGGAGDPILPLTVGDPLAIKDVVEPGMSRGRAARALTTHFRETFERELARV